MKAPKSYFSILCAGAAMTCIAGAQTTQSYADAVGEIATPGSGPHIDITSVNVTVNAAATDITFRINLAGSPLDSGQNWGKYLVGIRSGGNGTATGNGWVRPINFTPGMTHWIGTWADAGGDTCGGQVWTYSSGWSTTSTPTVTKDATGVIITSPVTALGLIPGETFAFDVYTSGGGSNDGAVDALSSPTTSISNWGDTFTTAALGSSPRPALKFTMPGTLTFVDWSADNANNGTANEDFDNDGVTNGVEYFMGEISSSFRSNPPSGRRGRHLAA